MTSLDLHLINESNTQLLHDVRAERSRGRLRTHRGTRSGASRIARLVETRRRIDEVAREA
jgi:hypothetical protein